MAEVEAELLELADFEALIGYLKVHSFGHMMRHMDSLVVPGCTPYRALPWQ